MLPFQILPQVSLHLGTTNLVTVTPEILPLSLHLVLLCLRPVHAGDAKTAVILFPNQWRLLWRNTGQISFIANFKLFILLDFSCLNLTYTTA